jgi:hypothetical protein
MSQHMSEEELNNLTSVIDTYNYDKKETITAAGLHETLWKGLNQLKNAENKSALLEGWKYSSQFASAESTHELRVSHFKKLEENLWEQSFVLYFWMCIYH